MSIEENESTIEEFKKYVNEPEKSVPIEPMPKRLVVSSILLILFGGIFGLIGGILIFGKQKHGISLAYFGIFNFALNAVLVANLFVLGAINGGQKFYYILLISIALLAVAYIMFSGLTSYKSKMFIRDNFKNR
jgi:hypothetical protein